MTGNATVAGFRVKLLVSMMLVVSVLTAFALLWAQRNVAANVERELKRHFEEELASLHTVQSMRQAALAERCRSLASRPRIHAALEDDALDLLYQCAKDEMFDVMVPEGETPPVNSTRTLNAVFYRFLDSEGRVIPAPPGAEAGELLPDEEAQLAMKEAPRGKEDGCLIRRLPDGEEVATELVAMPIISTETGQVIAGVVLGFRPAERGPDDSALGMRTGLSVNGRLYFPSLSGHALASLEAEIAAQIAAGDEGKSSFAVEVDGKPHLLFQRQLNIGSEYPPVYEVCVYPLDEMIARQRQLRWEVLGGGVALLLAGLVASHFLSGRLSKPVEKLAIDSEVNRAQRERAETQLEMTAAELQRAARFSSDASHQLKTPVSVLRAGLEGLLAENNLSPSSREEISTLIHQTYRLTGIVEDLLLLSRMDAGRLELAFEPVNLSYLVEAALDDVGARSEGDEIAIETDFPPELYISGEKRYTAMILQNLVENARKYNRPGGRIRVSAHVEGEQVSVIVGNTGKSVPPGAREHIFERFHRGSVGENVPGHGLGLNIAWELARLHGGELRFVRSEDDWTEFGVLFRLAADRHLSAIAHG